MVANVAMTHLQWTQPPISNSPSFPQTLASALTSLASSRKRSGNDVVASRCNIHRLDRSSLFGARSKPRCRSSVRRASSASLDAFSDEEFSKRIQELAMKFQLSDDNSNADESKEPSEIEDRNQINTNASSPSSLEIDSVEPRWGEIYREPPDWPVIEEEIVVERKANSLDLPFSLRIIKRKKQSQSDEGAIGIRDSAYCSVKKAFSSMVFIIRELHSYTLQMRELLFFEDLQGIMGRVQKEMQASFVWLFQQVFSHTPTLMVYVMILLANFTVHSMTSNAAITISPESATTATVEVASTFDSPTLSSQKFDSSAVKSFSIGGSHGGGGTTKPMASGTDGDGRFDRSGYLHPTIVPDGSANKVSPLTAREEESVSGQEEVRMWNAVLDEASKMQAEMRGDSFDSDTIQKLVSPVMTKMESDEEYPEYFRTELLYQTGLAQEPENPLLLANFAQFLCLVAHDYDRAEEYFKAATSIEPKDAEACSKYASFLWHVKKDLWAAEETFLEAISADPDNSYYAGNYAHFLWSTGGEDTCFPLDASEAKGALEA